MGSGEYSSQARSKEAELQSGGCHHEAAVPAQAHCRDAALHGCPSLLRSRGHKGASQWGAGPLCLQSPSPVLSVSGCSPSRAASLRFVLHFSHF